MEKEPAHQETHEIKIVEKKDWTFRELIIFVILVVAIVLPVRIFIAQPFVVNGESMDPTFHTGQFIIVDQLSYRLGEPERGDVVIFRFPQDPSKFFIKRIIGLPGETVTLKGQEVTITDKNGETFVLEEPYIELDRETYANTSLEDDEYFVMGDNRLRSLDSRIWGPLKKDHILGRAYIRLLPVDKVDFLPGEYHFQF